MSNLMKTAVVLCAVMMGLTAQARDRQCFDNNWRFHLGDSVQMSKVEYNDSWWRKLDVPHDWAIEGDFYTGNPSGAGGGALPGGIGWYRKHFRIEELKNGKTEGLQSFHSSTFQYFLEFDGVYMNSTVYVNGHKVGYRPYGYSSFEYDITPYLKEGENVVAVRVDNSDQPNSRWYSGCGIYRHVWLTKTDPIHVKHWGVHVETQADGKVFVEADIENPSNAKLNITHTLYGPDGKVVARANGQSSKFKVQR